MDVELARSRRGRAALRPARHGCLRPVTHFSALYRALRGWPLWPEPGVSPFGYQDTGRPDQGISLPRRDTPGQGVTVTVAIPEGRD